VNTIDLFADRLCRLCKHWTGTEEHAAQEVAALCRVRKDAHGRAKRVYADETCDQFHDAARKAA
jgi:hypothetical protein